MSGYGVAKKSERGDKQPEKKNECSCGVVIHAGETLCKACKAEVASE
jgi:hypothetical protein